MKKSFFEFVRVSIFCPIFLVTILLAQLFLLGCSSDTSPSDDTISKKIDSIMNSTQKEMKSPGWLLGIWTPTKSYEMSSGMADISNNIKIDKSQLLRVGSITKTFTATVILILCDEGKLQLDDKLIKYLPGFPKGDKISIKHLLMHKSGLSSWDENDEIRMSVFNGTSTWTIDKLIEWAGTQPLLFEPGAGYHYSNVGYFILGKIIEQTSKMSVAQAIREKIAVPLGLSHTFMSESAHPDGDVIHGYDASSGSVVDMTGTPQADILNYDLSWTAGGMLSTIDDLRIWARALVNGNLISDSLHKQQLPVLTPAGQGSPYKNGYGYGLNQTDEWLGHTGAVCGFTCNMSYNPKDDVIIISFFNKFSAFEKDANTADGNAIAANFLALARLMCPDTFKEQ